MMQGQQFRLLRQTAYGKETLYESRELTDIATFIAEKEAPHRQEAATDGGIEWRDRVPKSVGGGDR